MQTELRLRATRSPIGVALMVVVTAVLLAVNTEAQEAKAKQLYQQAWHLEDAAGDPAAAIRVYQQVLAAAGSERALAARALLRIGVCRSRLGDRSASDAFAAVVRDYDDQADVVAEAGAWLARTRAAASPASSPRAGTGLDATQLMATGDIEGLASMSPDGRFLVYSSWAEDGNLVVREVSTGATRTITRDSAVRTKGTPQVFSPSFSPDGARIAFAVFEGTGAASTSSLRIVSSDGTNERILARGTPAGHIGFVYDWSPDGASLAIELYSTGQSRLALVSVATGAIAPLKSTAWRKAFVASFSPDGKFLVYSLPPAEGAPDSGVFMLAVDGQSPEVKLADGDSPAWTPDGRGVVYFSDRSGVSDLWMVAVDGAKAGLPVLIRPNIGNINRGFTRDGSFFYEMRNQGRDVFTARFDAEQRLSEPALLSNAFVGSNGGGSWSPDGRFVAIVRASGPAAKGQLIIRTVASGEERAVPTKFASWLPGQNFGSRWFPDGRSLVMRDRGDGRDAFVKVDVQTGAQETLVSSTIGGSTVNFDLAPDGRFFYYVRRNADAPSGEITFTVVSRDLQSGAERALHTVKAPAQGMRGLTLSPSGAHLAVRDTSAQALMLLPVDGGTPTVLARGGESIEPMAWTNDGRYILGTVAEGDLKRLAAVPVAGGPAIKLNLVAANIGPVSVCKGDGAIAVSVTRPRHELWLVRNLLASVQSR